MKLVYPNYNESIMSVTNSFLHYYGVHNKYPTLPALDEVLQEKPYNHIVYVLLDGLGMNVINHHLSDSDAIKKYVKRPISSVFPPTTVAATDAVLSGVPPIENGHVAWVQYYKEEDTHAIVFQNRDFYTGEFYTEDLRQKYYKFTTMYEQINRVQPHVQTNEFFPSFREGGSESFAQEIERVLLATHNTDQSFNYLYWIEPDLTQHVNGTYSKETGNVVKALNKDFESLINNVTEDTLVVLIADHGLIDVQTIPLFEYEDITSHFIRKPGLEPRVTTFFIKEEETEAFETAFNKHFQKQFKLYKTEDFLKTKLFGEGMMHPNLAQSFGNYISIALDTYMFGLHEGKEYKAHHAGMSEEEMMVPLVIYRKK